MVHVTTRTHIDPTTGQQYQDTLLCECCHLSEQRHAQHYGGARPAVRVVHLPEEMIMVCGVCQQAVDGAAFEYRVAAPETEAEAEAEAEAERFAQLCATATPL